MADIILEATSTELNYSAGVTSPIQTQIDAIKDSLATVEYEFVASRDYMAGEYFIYDGVLYIVLTDVLSGMNFSIGTNVKRVDDGYFNSLLSPETKTKWETISSSTSGNLDKIIYYLADFSTTSKTTTVSSVITVNSTNATISSANFVKCGRVAQIYINWKNKKSISVPASGNVTNYSVGTLVSGKRPSIVTAAQSQGDGIGSAWYSINTSGAVSLTFCESTGKARTIAANSTFNLCATYILP